MTGEDVDTAICGNYLFFLNKRSRGTYTMRVVCESCGASYKIPESKLVKEVNKATCRKCGFRMMIRRPTTVAAVEADDHTDPTEAATQVTSNPLERQDAERQLLDAATRIEKVPVNEWEEDSPTNVQPDPSVPPLPTAIGRPPPAGVPAGRAATDMTIALIGTFASAAGAMLLATNTSGLAAQRMGGLSIALWGALTCLFLLVTGNLWRQKGNIPISVVLATVLSVGGTGFVELALHSSPASDAPLAAEEPVQNAPDVDAEADPQTEDAIDNATDDEEAKDGDTEEAVAEADIPVPPPAVEPVAPTPAPPAPPAPAEPEALDEPDFDELVAEAEPEPTAAEERRRQAVEEAAQARTNERRQRETAAAQRRRAAQQRAQREAAAAAAAAPPAAAEPPKMKSLPLTVVDTLIRSNMSVKRCFYNEKQTTGEMPTRVNVRFTVLQSGRVSSARVITDEYKGGPLDSCLSRSFRAIQFPAFEGESLTMNYPFVL